jgi:hypothetical protein
VLLRLLDLRLRPYNLEPAGLQQLCTNRAIRRLTFFYPAQACQHQPHHSAFVLFNVRARSVLNLRRVTTSSDWTVTVCGSPFVSTRIDTHHTTLYRPITVALGYPQSGSSNTLHEPIEPPLPCTILIRERNGIDLLGRYSHV